MADLCAVVLAAGVSRRMGDANKLLLPMNDGTAMIRRVVQTYVAGTPGAVTVVTGHEAEQVRAALVGLPVTFAHNRDFARGQPMSVAAGLRAAPPGDLLIGLGDQPLLKASDLADLIASHRLADSRRISIPVRDGQRGNPILVPEDLRATLLADPKRPGCMHITRTRADLVQHLPLPHPGFYLDVDTPAGFAAFREGDTS